MDPEILPQDEFWSGMYAAGDVPWDIGLAAPPLTRLCEGIDPAAFPRVLVPGCGYGHDALWLADRGHDVTAVDIAQEPIELLAARSRGKLRAVVDDVFDLPSLHWQPFDLVAEHTCFCAIDPGRAREYVDVILALLRPGGLLAALFFAHGRPGGPPYSTSEEEVRRLFGERLDMIAMERPTDSVPSRRGEEILALFRRPPREGR